MWPVVTQPAEELSAAQLDAAVEQACRPILCLLQALAAQASNLEPRLWLVTAGAQVVSPGETLNGVAQSTVWGLGNVVAMEYPDFACQANRS